MQRKAYDKSMLSWTWNKMKNLNSPKSQNGGGAGKSHLIETIYHTATKTYKYAPMNLEKPTVLLAAINIGGTTINTASAIPKNHHNIIIAVFLPQNHAIYI